MLLFDEDRNGMATIKDIQRVLSTYTELSNEDRERFIKICALSHELTP